MRELIKINDNKEIVEHYKQEFLNLISQYGYTAEIELYQIEPNRNNNEVGYYSQGIKQH